MVNKVGEGPRDTVGRIEAGEVDLVINTPTAAGPAATVGIRLPLRSRKVPCVTTIQGAPAVARSLRAGNDAITAPKSLQEWLAVVIADETADGRRQTAANPSPSPLWI